MQDVSKSEMVYENKSTSTSIRNNIHIMQDVSKLRDGLRKQRHLNFRTKQYSPYAWRILIRDGQWK